jgi:hypothetical protein
MVCNQGNENSISTFKFSFPWLIVNLSIFMDLLVICVFIFFD